MPSMPAEPSPPSATAAVPPNVTPPVVKPPTAVPPAAVPPAASMLAAAASQHCRFAARPSALRCGAGSTKLSMVLARKCSSSTSTHRLLRDTPSAATLARAYRPCTKTQMPRTHAPTRRT
uniref:Uncharacterized protein n=1 Tax=Chrysotila carterae TaxID=13221 RepID=A0A6S9RSU0_CHRCT|eukprot:1673999-Pleurochrysis_carterae.AAC.4